MGRVSRLPAVRTSSRSEPVGPRPRLSRGPAAHLRSPHVVPRAASARAVRRAPRAHRASASAGRSPTTTATTRRATPTRTSVEQGEEQMSTVKSSDTAHAERAKQEESAGGSTGYLLAGQASELERLQVQSRVWEPSGRRLLEKISDGRGTRVLDVGCG